MVSGTLVETSSGNVLEEQSLRTCSTPVPRPVKSEILGVRLNIVFLPVLYDFYKA